MKKLLVVAMFALVAGCDTRPTFNAEGFKCDPGNLCPDGLTCVDGICKSNASGGGAGGGTGGGVGGGTGGGGGGSIDGGDVCAGVSCDTPPANECPDSSTLRVFSTTGVCNPANGQCDYSFTDSICSTTCTAGVCPGSLCATVVCNTPPANSCQDPQTLKTFLPNGTCNSSNGQCSYGSTTQTCPNGCQNGACNVAPFSWAQKMPGVRSLVNGIDLAAQSSGNHVLVVGPNGYVAKWNGQAWSTLTSGTTRNLNAVWLYGTGSTVGGYIVGDQGTLLRYDGTAITAISVTGLTANLLSVHGINGDNAIVGGGSQVAIRGAGTWALGTYSLTGNSPTLITSVYAEPTGTPKLRAAGKCLNVTGTTSSPCAMQWSTGTTQAQFVDRDSSPPSGVTQYDAIGPDVDSSTGTYAFLGYGQNTRRYDSSSATFANNTTFNISAGKLTALTQAAAANTLYVLGNPSTSVNGALYRVAGNGGGGTPAVTKQSDLFGNSAAMSRNESGGVMVADNYVKAANIQRRGAVTDEFYDFGEDWISVSRANTGYVLVNDFGDVAAPDPQNTAAYDLFRSSLNGSTIITAAAGTGPVVLVGTSGTVQRFSNGTFTSLSSTATADLNAICRVSDTQFYAVGDSGTILSISGSPLTVTAMTNNGGTQNLLGVYCDSQRAFAVGAGGTVLKLSGSSWSQVPGVTGTPSLNTVAFVNGTLFVGGASTFAKFDGTSWTTLPSQSGIDSLQARSTTEVYGISGTQVYRFDGTAWTSVLTATSTLVAGSTGPNSFVFAGDDGVVVEGQ